MQSDKVYWRYVLFRNVDDLTVLEFIGHADLAATLAALRILILRRSIAVDLLTLLGDDLHVLLAWVLHHREILPAEHLGHVVPAHQSHHQRHGEDHRHVEQIDHHAQRIGVFLYGELAFSAGRFHASVFFSISFRDT